MRFLYVLKHKVYLSKTVRGFSMFNFALFYQSLSFCLIKSIYCFTLKRDNWGKVKLELRVASTYELPHELPNNLGDMILGNEELLRLFTLVFIDLKICEFELVTRGFELATRRFKLACNSRIWTHNS